MQMLLEAHSIFTGAHNSSKYCRHGSWKILGENTTDGVFIFMYEIGMLDSIECV